MNEEGVNQTFVYEGTTAGHTYDAATPPMGMIDGMGFPIAPSGNQGPPKPLMPQILDSDEPKIIDRK